MIGKITSITREKYEGYVYDLTVDSNHNYFANDILIHNCYMDSKETDENYENVVEKVDSYFGKLSENEKPFQVAIGGGEPTEHADFVKVLKKFYDLGITPNYTTNGMFTKKENVGDILEATKKYCGGVAISCHPHLKQYWDLAAFLFSRAKVRLNFHVIISDRDSVDEFIKIYNDYKDVVEYFVLLPYGEQGRAKHKEIDWEYLVEKLENVDEKQIAFGANFYKYLCNGKTHKFSVSLYEPEILSGFLDLKDMKLYKSSFNLTLK